MMKHELFMKQAITAAKQSLDLPVGAVIVYRDQVISAAWNACSAGKPFAHAEMEAMRKAAETLQTRYLNGCTLYVTLEPCPMCAGAILNARIDTCVFGAYDRRYGCCGSVYFLPMDSVFSHRTRCIGGVMEEECAALLGEAFTKMRM